MAWVEVDISSSDYARRRRELMEMMADLRSMGADALIDIPSVVVIGGQSAGKSSLVEAVSGVTLLSSVTARRAHTTIRRCPMECSMSSHATSWSCTITLRIYPDNGRDLQKPITVSFGPTITDRSEVEVWLRRAQAAILNPNIPSSSFHTKTIEELRNARNTLKFSRNVVCVSIEDPDATDLSFYDLPGLIQNEEAETVALVKSMAEHYTETENTIILTTIPMSWYVYELRNSFSLCSWVRCLDDMENQQSMSLARAADPDGKRTIGVLTKPDTLGVGAINQRRKWVEIIEGRSEEHTLRHGFYCEYFDTTSPWSDMIDRHRFGIPGFVSDVSRLLIQLIEEALPRLREDIDKLLAKCIKDIDALPLPLTNDPQIEVLERVNAFCDVFKSFVNGSHEDKRLAQRNRALYAIFKRDIRGTVPDFRPFNGPEGYVSLDDTEGKMTLTVRDPGVKAMGIYDIRRVIHEAIGWELPNNVPYQAKANLIAQFTKLWVAPSERCLAGINDVIDQVISTLISIHFGRFKVLEDYVGRPTYQEMCSAGAPDGEPAGGYAVESDMSPGYCSPVQGTPEHSSSKKMKSNASKGSMCRSSIPATPQKSDNFSDSINPHHPGSMSETPEAKALRALAEAGYANLRISDLARLLPPDSFEEELVVMADVRAYYHVAYKRIVDHIPFTIEHALHHALAKQLSQSLLTSLLTDVASGSNFSERMSELVSEDASITQKRAMLSTRKQRLSDIRQRLMTFSNGT
ncbi:P-loop containing nucleoside triphosphate hydrolase protein [Suillus paluster]|uniref:P-loop containing nucleoside triphosphate hydrolase protein n=1 Tax=Suillus paluster TaxID=48578 RepID=UPI001B886C13|nr:P-loop containing nucleoside triphosphate hydrolase protein [Suillus paluster]KAG1727762.1 P-loop containing nucleoside triphosphate hydrolase protein [Suillus paluster]